MGAAGSVPYESAEAALAAGKTPLEIACYVAATGYIAAFNAKDEAAVGALFKATEGAGRPPVMLGNNESGLPRPVKSEVILRLLRSVMFESYGFAIREAKIACDGVARPVSGVMGADAVVDLTLKIDAPLPNWLAPCGRPPPYPQAPVSELFGGADELPAQLTLGVDGAGKIVSVYWHLGPGAAPGVSAAGLQMARVRGRLCRREAADAAAAAADAASARDRAKATLESDALALRASVLGAAANASYWLEQRADADAAGPDAAATLQEGAAFHCEKHGAGSAEALCATLETARCADAAAAARLLEIWKAWGLYRVGNESGALRYTVFEPTEDHVVRSVAEYAHAKAREKHAALAGPTRDHFATPAAALAETEALEFAEAAHLEKGDT